MGSWPLSSELAELSTDVDVNQERIEEISSEIDGINTQIESLETATEELEASKLDITTFSTYKTNTDNTISSISENVSTLQNDLNTFKTNTQTHFNAIDAALNTFVGNDEFTEFSNAYTVFKNNVNQTLENLETTCSSLGSTKLNITDFESYQAEETEKINEIIANLDDNTLLLGTTDFTTSDYSTISDAIVSIQNEVNSFYEEYGNTKDLINEDIVKINNTIGNKTGLFEEYTGTLWQLVDELQIDINENASDIGLTKSDINNINTELIAFKSDVNISLANINRNITAINEELETKLDITTFETYQTTVDTTLSSLQSSIDNLNTTLNEESQIREDADTTIETNLENLQSAWDNFKGSSTLTLADIESFMANTNNSINELNNSLSTHNHDSRYYTESEIDTKLNTKQDNSSSLKITTNYFTVTSVANADTNVNMTNITGIASNRIKAVIPYFVASSAFNLKELVFISSPINTYEFSVGNPTSRNTTAYIRVYTIYV